VSSHCGFVWRVGDLRCVDSTPRCRYVGLLTGMRPQGFSVSVDERSEKYPSIIDGPIDNIISALEVSWGVALTHRCDTLPFVA